MPTDWIWWTTAGILALAGLLIAARALFGDRSRGRRRCPSCWYVMEAIESRRCPECGRTARRERHLYRTRRRWRRWVGGVLLVVIGIGVFWTHRVRTHGWITTTPTFAYALALPHLDSTAALAEIRTRVRSGTLATWEYRLIISRCLDILESDAEPAKLLEMARLIGWIEQGSRHFRIEQPWASWVRVSDVHRDRALAALVSHLDHEDSDVRLRMLEVVGTFRHEGVVAIPAIMGELASDDPRVLREVHGTLSLVSSVRLPRDLLDRTNAARRPTRPGIADVGPFNESRWLQHGPDFLSAIGACGTDVNAARAVLERFLASPLVADRAMSVWALTALDPEGHDADPILKLADDPDPLVRRQVVSSLACYPDHPRTPELLQSALEASSGSTLITTLGVIRSVGPGAAACLPQVRAMIDREEHDTIALDAWVAAGGDAHWAAETLLERHGVTPESCDLLAEWRVDSDMVRDSIESMLDADAPSLQAAAARALAACGGDRDLASRAMLDAALAQNGNPTFSRLFNMAASGDFSIPVLTEQLRSDAIAERSLAAWVLYHSGAQAAPALAELRAALDDPSPRVVRWAELAVKRIEYLQSHQDR